MVRPVGGAATEVAPARAGAGGMHLHVVLVAVGPHPLGPSLRLQPCSLGKELINQPSASVLGHDSGVAQNGTAVVRCREDHADDLLTNPADPPQLRPSSHRTRRGDELACRTLDILAAAPPGDAAVITHGRAPGDDFNKVVGRHSVDLALESDAALGRLRDNR